jgi:hypothetical protein
MSPRPESLAFFECCCVAYGLYMFECMMNVLNISFLSFLLSFLAGSTEEYWKRQDAAQAVALVELF